MDRKYLELRCKVVPNEAAGMAEIVQKDIDEATAAVYCMLSDLTDLTYLCREYAACTVASERHGIMLDVWSRMCKAFLAGYCYNRYGQMDALKIETTEVITAGLPNGYQPKSDRR